jgi:excinuclease UvrABC ATPase subunit
MPSLSRPDADLLEGLTTAIVVDQERLGANSRSTVGTATDANAMLRIVGCRWVLLICRGCSRPEAVFACGLAGTATPLAIPG